MMHLWNVLAIIKKVFRYVLRRMWFQHLLKFLWLVSWRKIIWILPLPELSIFWRRAGQQGYAQAGYACCAEPQAICAELCGILEFYQHELGKYYAHGVVSTDWAVRSACNQSDVKWWRHSIHAQIYGALWAYRDWQHNALPLLHPPQASFQTLQPLPLWLKSALHQSNPGFLEQNNTPGPFKREWLKQVYLYSTNKTLHLLYLRAKNISDIKQPYLQNESWMNMCCL